VPGLYTSPFTFGSRDTDLKDARYAVCGVPFDSSETYRTGSRFAPRAIREASREIEDFDILEGFDLSEVPIADHGDVIVSHGYAEETLKRTSDTVKEILTASAVPVLIGGEHTISYFALHGFERKPFYLTFDAHLDFHDEYINNRLSHACNQRRAAELLGIENVMAVGIRSGGRQEVKDAKKLGLNYIDFNECSDLDSLKLTILDAIKGREVYISIDMDVLDPKEAPGVCNPEPPGFTFEEMSELLDILKDVRLAGMDITEVTPMYDNYTPVIAAKLVYKTLVKCSK
jgi:agmatinase